MVTFLVREPFAQSFSYEIIFNTKHADLDVLLYYYKNYGKDDKRRLKGQHILNEIYEE